MTTDSHDFLKEEDNIDRFNETINDIFTNPRQKEFDRIVSEMTEHREKYQMQTSYYRNMKNNLNKDILDPNCSDRHDMFIADYAQCLKIPQYHSDQPGETYFISPMSINLFGIYNCDTHKMNEFIYPDYE